ncbi:myosin-binding protein 2-like [Mercurialis annua]|uniref:myosin-binding protein 2-like n=1 Tax=Mercurialis annua TaxID=3986 RepID=UPI00215F4862|nr:myosin-binding protein 2-like [Mercurialis annua]
MAANKFATILHRNTNKLTLILVYALLEWLLIIFLLLNSLFSYLIVKFADYFGLKRPCLWCSRLDHFFEPTKFHNSYRSLVCEAHATEISQLGYCFNHRKLAQSHDMCQECCVGDGNNNKVSEVFEVKSCSCCGVGLENTKLFCSDDFMTKPCSLSDLDNTQKENLVLGGEIDENEVYGGKKLGFVCDRCGDEQRVSENRVEEDFSCFVSSFDCKEMVVDEIHKDEIFVEKDEELAKNDGLNVSVDDPACDTKISKEVEARHLDFYIDQEDCHLIPVELMDSSSTDRKIPERNEKREVDNEDFVLEFDHKHVGVKYELVVDDVRKFEEKLPLLPIQECDEENMIDEVEPEGLNESEFENLSGAFADYELAKEDTEQADVDHLEQTCNGNKEDVRECREVVEEEMELDNNRVSEEALLVQIDEIEADVSIGTDIPDIEPIEDIKTVEEDPSTGNADCHAYDDSVSEEALEMQIDETEADISIGTEIPDHESVDDIQAGEVPSSHLCIEEDPSSSTSNADCHANDDSGHKQTGEDVIEFRALTVETRETMINTHSLCSESNDVEEDKVPDINTHLSCSENNDVEEDKVPDINTHLSCSESNDVEVDKIPDIKTNLSCSESNDVEEDKIPDINTHLLCSESNDVDEDKIPDTPTSVESLNHLHRKLLLLERRESSTEESLDGSVFSDIEAGEGVLTMEKLKSALRVERKALNALYAELEEERSASAVAANQTMAMINRLQEEKAAMQMEALQYQRMMEEQSEYDQEALQLLNEVMVKREKERAELEKELEVYRKKLQVFETKEKFMMLKRRKESSGRSGTSSSASYSNAEDSSDGLSVDLNHEAKEEDGFDHHHENINQNTPVEAVVDFEESLNNFEVERLSILEQLKVLEEKLFTLSDEEEQYFEDIKSVDHLHEENGNGYDEDFDHSNGVSNGHYKEMNGKHHQERKIIGAKAKRLLPLFDAIVTEAEEDGMLNEYEEGVDSIVVLKPSDKFDIDTKKLAIEEEVDHVYERLHALEADREFMKHCITSLRKGDKGIELLQEILQHLRDLRSVELRSRNMDDGAL